MHYRWFRYKNNIAVGVCRCKGEKGYPGRCQEGSVSNTILRYPVRRVGREKSENRFRPQQQKHIPVQIKTVKTEANMSTMSMNDRTFVFELFVE
jgi:hypothetical protein